MFFGRNDDIQSLFEINWPLDATTKNGFLIFGKPSMYVVLRKPNKNGSVLIHAIH